MKCFKNFILNILYIFFLIKKNIQSILLIKPSFQLRVLIYHDIKSDIQIKLFQNQILSLKKEYVFISPVEFEKLLKKKNKPNKKYILLTFDDGFKSNRKLAEEILNKLNIKALFFIISDFISKPLESPTYEKIINNIYPNGPNKEELSKPMDYDDIKFLLTSGHQIGCHTLSHKKLSSLENFNDLKSEIISSKIDLENNFDIKIKHFAFPFGTYESINHYSIRVLNQNYEYIFSGLRGNNKQITKLIYRDAVNPEMKIIRLKSFLNGNADFFYKRKFKKLKEYLN